MEISRIAVSVESKESEKSPRRAESKQSEKPAKRVVDEGKHSETSNLCLMCKKIRTKFDGVTPCPHCGHVGKMVQTDNQLLLGKATSYLYQAITNRHGKTDIQKWMRSNCLVFDESIGMEYKHEYFILYAEYQKLVDETLEKFIESEKMTGEDFRNICANVVGEEDGESPQLNMLLAAAKFEKFVTLMKSMSKKVKLDSAPLNFIVPVGALGVGEDKIRKEKIDIDSPSFSSPKSKHK